MIIYFRQLTDASMLLWCMHFHPVGNVATSYTINTDLMLFAYDTVKSQLTPKPGEEPKIHVPISLIADAVAGISSTICTYPLELLKTRLTMQRGAYKNLMDAFLKIVLEEGPAELYRGLTPSIVGVIPYAATIYFAYDALRKAYKKVFDKDEIENIATLLIGSAAGAILMNI